MYTPPARRMSEARAQYVPYPKAPAGAPNVVMIVLDDVGFAQLGCFGSPIATPHIDRLAAAGLRYNRFHVTSICSSTRAALLSGRNHHAVGMGLTEETPLGFPGYTGRIPPSAALLPRVLRDNGYNTFAVGKWHLAPRGEYSASGPMTRWPLGMGFERYYGFLGAETSQWAPELCRDNTFVDPPRSPPEGYHLTEDLADQAIGMVLDQRQATPDKPLLLYLATGAAHAPHHVPPAWVEPYRGRFDDGWESFRQTTFERQVAQGVVPAGTTLSPRPSWVQDWDGLPAVERRLFARYMEVFAGFMTHTDAQIGRLLDFLDTRDDLANTLVLLLSDNGASAEGTPTGTLNEPDAWMGQAESVEDSLGRIDEIGGHRAFNHYPWGWAWAGNTPLRLWKRYSWLGGVRTPLIVRWPGRLRDPGALRSQFCHAIDVLPTVLDAAGVDAPTVVDGVTQQPVQGASLTTTFESPDAPSPRSTQYFEMHGSRGIYHGGWKATTDYVSPLFGERAHLTGSQDLDTDRWTLVNLDDDFSEAHDLSAQYPERAEQLIQLWWAEAGANQVLPLLDDPRAMGTAGHPGEFPPPARATYTPGGGPICESQLPPMIGGFTAAAEVDVPDGDPARGVVCVLGDRNGGWGLYLLDGVAVTTLISGRRITRAGGGAALPPGAHTIAVRYQADRLSLFVDDHEAASAADPGLFLFPALSTAGAGMLIGRDRGLALCDDYQPPFPFTATLHRVTIESHRRPRRPDPDAFETATRAD
jgi:arylsulfatase A-like enzyme